MKITEIILGKDNASAIRINPTKTIFWTGAGISSIMPSALPLGSDLTDAYLEAALGNNWSSFVALWNNHFPQIKESVNNGVWSAPKPIGKYTAADVADTSKKVKERPRLEYIIGEMDKLDKYFKSITFAKPENQKLFKRSSSLAAIKKFQIEPCLYHYRLADLSRAGSVMVTANFDDGIEKALGVDATKVIERFETAAVENGSGNYVFHFHGIATDNPDNFGATINNMSKGLNETFQEYICSLLEAGYDIVFVGYGGVDFFDVEPFFKRLSEMNYPGKAIYLQYVRGGLKEREEVKKREKTYEYLLKPFMNQYIIYGDTEEFFQAIYDHYNPIDPAIESGTLHNCGAFRAATDYLKSIVNEQVDKDMYHFINMFRICSQLNINPGRFYPDWIDRIKRIYQLWKDDGPDTVKHMTVVDGQKNDGIVDDIYSNNWHHKKLMETGIKKELQPYIHLWERKHKNVMQDFNRMFRGYGCFLPKKVVKKYVDKTIDILNNNMTDEKSVDISRGTVMYLCGWQTKIFMGMYLKIHIGKGRLLFLKRCIDDLLKYPFTRFRYRTHYLSLCRQAGYIDLAINPEKKEYRGDIQKEWDICMQTPILFDAGQVLNARIKQAEILGITDGVWELTQIRQRILNLRNEKDPATY